MDLIRSTARAALVLFGLLAGAGGAEVALRVAGYQFATFPAVQFGWPQPQEIRDVFKPDRELFWVTRDYDTRLADARSAPPAVVFMGDSCTQFSTWPELTLHALASRHPALSTGVSLAVAGWSSEQGLRQLRRDVLPLHPRVVVVYYGWNDHWLAFGKPDAEVHSGPVSFWLAEHVRLDELVVRARLAWAARSGDRPYRVPLDRYRANLETIAGLARAAGIRAVFITAPSSHQQGHEPAYLARRHLWRLADLVPLHASYVEATRQAAAAAGADVCDAALAFHRFPEPVARYFNRDGIHLNDRGARALADLVAGCLVGAAPPSRPL